MCYKATDEKPLTLLLKLCTQSTLGALEWEVAVFLPLSILVSKRIILGGSFFLWTTKVVKNTHWNFKSQIVMLNHNDVLLYRLISSPLYMYGRVVSLSWIYKRVMGLYPIQKKTTELYWLSVSLQTYITQSRDRFIPPK